MRNDIYYQSVNNRVSHSGLLAIPGYDQQQLGSQGLQNSVLYEVEAQSEAG